MRDWQQYQYSVLMSKSWICCAPIYEEISFLSKKTTFDSCLAQKMLKSRKVANNKYTKSISSIFTRRFSKYKFYDAWAVKLGMGIQSLWVVYYLLQISLILSCANKCRCILVTGAYGAQKTDINISLTAVGLLWTATDFIVKGLIGKSVQKANPMNEEGTWPFQITLPFSLIFYTSYMLSFGSQRFSWVYQRKREIYQRMRKRLSKIPYNNWLITISCSFQFFLSFKNWVQMTVQRYVFFAWPYMVCLISFE